MSTHQQGGGRGRSRPQQRLVGGGGGAAPGAVALKTEEEIYEFERKALLRDLTMAHEGLRDREKRRQEASGLARRLKLENSGLRSRVRDMEVDRSKRLSQFETAARRDATLRQLLVSASAAMRGAQRMGEAERQRSAVLEEEACTITGENEHLEALVAQCRELLTSSEEGRLKAQNDRDAAQSLAKTLEEKLTSTELKLAQSGEELERARGELDSVKLKSTQLEGEMAMVGLELESCKLESAHLEEELQRVEGERDELEACVALVKTQFRESEARTESLAKGRDELEEETAVLVDELEAHLSLTVSQLREAESKVKSVAGQMESLRSERDTLRSRVARTAELEAQLSTLEFQLSESRATASSSEAEVEAMKRKQIELESQARALGENVKAKTQELSLALRTLTSLREKCNVLEEGAQPAQDSSKVMVGSGEVGAANASYSRSSENPAAEDGRDTERLSPLSAVIPPTVFHGSLDARHWPPALSVENVETSTQIDGEMAADEHGALGTLMAAVCAVLSVPEAGGSSPHQLARQLRAWADKREHRLSGATRDLVAAQRAQADLSMELRRLKGQLRLMDGEVTKAKGACEDASGALCRMTSLEIEARRAQALASAHTSQLAKIPKDTLVANATIRCLEDELSQQQQIFTQKIEELASVHAAERRRESARAREQALVIHQLTDTLAARSTSCNYENIP
jgi:chromosome segregation ATPase